MRHKIMTAFVCAIMTISVIPVYADDTQTDQAVTTEVSTETAATVQETKRTQSKEQLKKKTTSKKHTKTKKTKLKKKEENKVIPMPTQVIRPDRCANGAGYPSACRAARPGGCSCPAGPGSAGPPW